MWRISPVSSISQHRRLLCTWGPKLWHPRREHSVGISPGPISPGHHDAEIDSIVTIVAAATGSKSAQ
jgi:hypothetical protein